MSLVFCVLTPFAAANVPRYDATWQFAVELQQDYSVRAVEALTSRCDSNRAFRRMAAPLGSAIMDDPSSRASWEKDFWPAVEAELKEFATYESLLIDRIGLLEGERVLSCVFQRADGMFSILLLWVEEQPNGQIRIVDYRGMGSSLEMSRKFRHLMILFASVFHPSLDDEERELAFAPDGALRAKNYFSTLRHGMPHEAFKEITRLPDTVKRTRLWRDWRDQLALGGLRPALEHARAAAAAGEPLNILIALAESAANDDVAARLETLDRMATDALHSPFVRTVKAGVLLESGRTAEALAVARDVYRLNPFSVHACAIAARAAARAMQESDAIDALHAWAHLAAREDIDRLLEQDSTLAAFRATPAYRDWLTPTAR